MILEHCNRLSCVQMIEALTDKRDFWKEAYARQDARWIEANKELAAAQAQVALLREALAEASNEISDWGQYASEYFQDKYKLTEVVERFAAIASGEMK